MAGISSQALSFGSPENKRGFNGGNEMQNKEFSDFSGLEEYDANFRRYNPQIGRFNQIDPMAGGSMNVSPYAFSNNNPINYNDPFGLDTVKVPIPPHYQPGQIIYVPNPSDPNQNFAYTYDPKTKQLTSVGGNGNLSTVTVKTPGYRNFLNLNIDLPAPIHEMDNWRWTMFDRIKYHANMIQGGEPDWVLANIQDYKNEYAANQAYRTTSLAAALIILSPLIIEASPELLSALQDASETGEVGTIRTVDAINEARADVAEKIVRVLSKYKLADYSTMKAILESGREYKSAQELFEQGQEIYDFTKDFIDLMGK
jgi:RHS repeat-associated protein